MIRISRPFGECKQCDAFKPALNVKKIRGETTETADQFVEVVCSNAWVCNQIRKAIDRGKVQRDEQDDV